MAASQNDLFESRFQAIAKGDGTWFSAEHQQAVTQRWIESVQLSCTPPGELVEFGCGTGENLRALADAGWSVTGYDVSPTAISIAERRASGRGQWKVVDLGLPMACDAARFDVVLDGDCLHYMIGARRGHFLANARKHLKPSGWFIVETLIGTPEKIPPDSEFDPVTRTTATAGLPMNYWAEEDMLLAELKAIGFDVHHVQSRQAECETLTVWARRLS